MSFFIKFGRSFFELRSIRCITVTGILIALDIVLKFLSIKITADLKITFAYLALATIGMLYGPAVSFIAGVITDVIGFMINPDGGFSPLFTIIEAAGAMIYGIFLYELKPSPIVEERRAHDARFYIDTAVRSVLYGIVCAEILALILCVFGNIIYPMSAESSNALKIAKVVLNMPLLYSAAGVGFIYGAFFTFLIKMKSGKSDVRSSLRIIFSKVTVVVVCNLIMTPVAMVLSGYMTWDSMISAYPLRLIKNAVQCPVDCLILLLVLFPILTAYKKVFPEKNGRKRLKEQESVN